jgi:signal transduction histidine kinase
VGAGDTVEVWVRDTGIGVKEEDLEHIFKPFVTTKVAGLGMGLSITRSIVEGRMAGGSGPSATRTEASVFTSRFRPAPVPDRSA